MKPQLFIPTLLLAGAALQGAAAGWEAPPEQQKEGRFWRFHWYQRGITNGNPAYDTRFRVNAPEVSLHPSFGRRSEARENGLMLLKTEEDLFQVTAAEFYCEAWGGHPGTANKRISINGRSMYWLPRVGCEERNCTYFYPSIPLKITDLVNGYQALQFAVDQGSTFWGHMLVDNAAVRVALTNTHTDLLSVKLSSFTATVSGELASEKERLTLKLVCPPAALSQIAEVDFQGWYSGYDENGNNKPLDWHGFTKNRRAVGTLGHASEPPFECTWDTRMLAPQKRVAVRAVVRFRAETNLVFLTAATTGFEIPERARTRVIQLAAQDLPRPFWSRANQKKTCSFELPVDPGQIEAAELHVVTWTGGAGAVQQYFKLNGVHYPVAEGTAHEVQYSVLPVEPKTLQKERNLVELLSDTEHHGIEVLYPGPALVVRHRLAD